MELTKKAVAEVEKLKAVVVELEKDLETVNLRARNAQDYKLHQMYQRERNRLSDRRYKTQDRIQGIEASGISGGEERALLKEATGYNRYDGNWVTIERSKNLGYTTYVKIGWSKTVAGFAKIAYTQYSGFMHNVKGCSGLANKKTFDAFTRMTEAEVNARLATGLKTEVNFMGHEEKMITLNKTAADLRAQAEG